MPRLPARWLLLAAALLSSLTIAACDDTSPVASSATPLPTASSPLPQLFLLRADQMRGYTRSNSQALSATIVAAEANNPALAKTLTDQGYLEGATWTFSAPTPNTAGLPFGQVISQAAIFNDAAGASRNADFEKSARNQPPSNGGTISPVSDLPATGVDSLTVYVAQSIEGSNSAQTYLAIMRRGRVVAELLAGGDPTTATEKNFSTLLMLAESQLASAPG
jgi:hypothetical protein